MKALEETFERITIRNFSHKPTKLNTELIATFYELTAAFKTGFSENIWRDDFTSLTDLWPMFPFYSPWKHTKTNGCLVFSGGIKWEHWSIYSIFYLNFVALFIKPEYSIFVNFKTKDWNHSFITFSKFSEKLTYFTPWSHSYVWMNEWSLLWLFILENYP